MVVFLAYSLEKKQENIKRFSIGFLPHIFAYGLFAVCIFQQPDFGSVVILGALTLLMMFVGGVRCTHIFQILCLSSQKVRLYLRTLLSKINQKLPFWTGKCLILHGLVTS